MNSYRHDGSTPGRRALPLLVVVFGLVATMTLVRPPAAEASHGSTGSIVYTNGPTRTDDTIGGDVWLTSPDGATKVRVTFNADTPDPDGMGDKPYFSPSQSDSGDIVAVRNQLEADGSIRGYLWIMNRSGAVIDKFAPPQNPFGAPERL